MSTRIINLIVALVLVAQGGCLRACQLQRMIVGDNDGASPKSCVVSAAEFQSTPSFGPTNSAFSVDKGSGSSDKSETCPCELRKGLAQPERMDSGVAFDLYAPLLTLNVVTPVPVCPTTHLLGAKPAPPLASYSTPLLI